MGYIFCLYRNKGTYEILCRRSIHSTPGPQQPLLYKKCASKKKNGDEQSNPKTIVETSGTVFYLGAIKFKLMGNKILPGPGLKEGANHFIHDPGERTVLVKPGRPWADDDEHQGLMRVKIPDRDLALDTLQITGRIPLGRHFLQEHLEIDEDFLRRSGVSGEHLNLTPLQGGNWIIEPFPGKAVFLELGERPVRLQQGDILRLAAPQQVGEFVISLSC